MVRAFLHLAKEGIRLDADHAHADQHQGCDAKCAHNAHADFLALRQSVAAVLASLGVHEEARAMTPMAI